MRRAARVFSTTILLLAVTGATIWAALALWYRFPAPEPFNGVVAGLVGLFGLFTVAALFSRLRLPMLVAYAIAFGALLLWWNSIKPPAQGDWAPEVARQVTGTIDGDTLTLTDLRDFEWHSATDFTPRWATRTYDLSKLRTLDLFMSYWAGPEMAHVILSFGFEGGDYLAWSIEVRRGVAGKFSPIGDLFKSNPLVIVAADERDVVGVRSNFRKEDVQLYRLRVPPQAAKVLLLEYVEDSNELAAKPRFYNSLTTNCTTTIFKMIRAVGDALPFDWRLIVNGYLPDYVYDRGALTDGLSLEALRAASHIDARAQAAGLSPDFSRLIRVGVPSPYSSE